MLFAGCTTKSNSEFTDPIDFQIKNNDYGYFADFIYDFSKDNRLTVMWFGYYNVEKPQRWFESADKTTFKLKAYLLAEENGYIFASELFKDGMVQLLVNCGDKKSQWLSTLKLLEKELKTDEGFVIPEGFSIDCG